MNNTFQQLMRAATRLTQSGRLQQATQAIQRALRGATAPVEAEPVQVTPVQMPGVSTTLAASPPVLDAGVFEAERPIPAPARTGTGEFTGGSHSHASLTRQYKLYTPPGHAGRQLPLVVMLHGCTQDPDDFATGTDMNERAREQGFFVLYPAQSQDANPSRCWNWFKHNHQRHGSGEPALLASLTCSIIERHGMDARRVYIAGLSAGGAMAAIVADAYPEIFAALGVHSGLPSGAAGNLVEALSVMKNGTAGAMTMARSMLAGTGAIAPPAPRMALPTIVFHGDQDHTVHPSNGAQVVAAALATLPASSTRVEQGICADGRRYTRSIHHASNGNNLAEHWLVHGAGHAWSGGQLGGSYTDAQGPDATGEMLRFFFDQPYGPRH